MHIPQSDPPRRRRGIRIPKSDRVLALVGPTASGKTPLSLILAEMLNAEIVSADSRQIYRYLTIGTAKPSLSDLTRIPHHFVDVLDPSQEYNAGEYGKHAREIIKDIFHRNKVPILVGGSGLYVKAVVDGLFEGPGKDPEVRKQLEDRLEREGLESLLKELRKVDPVSAVGMEPGKTRRVVRALEVYYTSGMPITKFHLEQNTKPSFEVVQFGLQWDRRELYRRINARVESMIEQGLIEEVKSLQRYGRRLNALNTVGYKEVFEYLEGKLAYEGMIALVKQNSRRFAKRQQTWFRADKRIHWIDVAEETDFNQIANRIKVKFLKKSFR